MLTTSEIRLAQPQDAPIIAEMSRDYIEYGLGWNWTSQRVQKSIRDASSNVTVACGDGKLLGFGIMHYKKDDAHLLLLATNIAYRRQGIGTQLVKWLEDCAILCGIRWLQVEARETNPAALAFYQKLGFDPVSRLPRYYRGVEDAILLAKDCWQNVPSADFIAGFSGNSRGRQEQDNSNQDNFSAN